MINQNITKIAIVPYQTLQELQFCIYSPSCWTVNIENLLLYKMFFSILQNILILTNVTQGFAKIYSFEVQCIHICCLVSQQEKYCLHGW